MEQQLKKETKALLSLLFDKKYKEPDITGTTPLLNKAYEIAKLSPLSPQKKFEESIVCNLVWHFQDFNQITLSELDSYIQVSQFSCERILEAFGDFVRNTETNEDINFKAYVARMVQGLSRTIFSLDYITKRFSSLKNNDPWIFSELVITCNWEAGVESIKEILKNNSDTSYLFALLPQWIKVEDTDEKISYALSEWYEYFNETDKKIASYYASNFGYKLSQNTTQKEQTNEGVINALIEDRGFLSFLHCSLTPIYKTLQT